MHQRDPRGWRSDLPPNPGFLVGILLAALVVVGLFAFWPRTTTTGTAMRDDSPRVERPSKSPTPGPAAPTPSPAKPQPQ
jgi:hypothetical protein